MDIIYRQFHRSIQMCMSQPKIISKYLFQKFTRILYFLAAFCCHEGEWNLGQMHFLQFFSFSLLHFLLLLIFTRDFLGEQNVRKKAALCRPTAQESLNPKIICSSTIHKGSHCNVQLIKQMLAINIQRNISRCLF